ncbi:MAG: FAD-dependent oxidoreductase [Actinomycetota bacterium]|nr:FAD-dependent oxidoreductase [Actinomycetota bacterium]
MTITDHRIADATGQVQPHVEVLSDRCAGCQECVVRCPAGALSMDPARWIAQADDGRCVGCRQCVRTCPFAAITVDGPLVVAERVALAPRLPEPLVGSREATRPGIADLAAARLEASRCLDCPDPTCVRGCPVHNDIPGFIQALAAGDLDGAHRVLARTSCLPDVCSRVCDQAVQCEGACSWSLAGGVPVAIGALERFIADHAPVPLPARVDERGEGLSVGIVGSGPAGIGAAYELVRSGAAVTVYEKSERPGGLLSWGIPEFTLPAAVARRPWDALCAAGVDLRCESEVAPDQVATLLRHHDAVVLAHGAGVPLRLPVPGGELDGVCDATRFLTTAHLALAQGRELELIETAGGRPATVLVLGAGNTAMDVARLARRFGHRAICVDWMDPRFAPVRPDELAEAAEEGVEIRFCSTLERLEGSEGKVCRAVLSRTRQARGTKAPKVIEHGAVSLEVDLVVMAMGYRLDPGFAALVPSAPLRRQARGIPPREWQASGLLAGGTPPFARRQPVGRLALGREVGRLSAGLGAGERIWVAGDALVGPATVVEAMAQGRRAAQSILDQRPTRHPHAAPGREPLVLVAYESRGGRTERAAGALAGELGARGLRVHLQRLAAVGLPEIAAADLVVVGTWVEGFVVAGVQPARPTRRWLEGLPSLGARKFATFCTYAVAPRTAPALLRAALEGNGAQVVAEAALSPGDTTLALGRLADEIAGVLLPPPSRNDLAAHARALAPVMAAAAAGDRLLRYAGGRRDLLLAARAELIERIGADAHDVDASAALKVIDRALAARVEVGAR